MWFADIVFVHLGDIAVNPVHQVFGKSASELSVVRIILVSDDLYALGDEFQIIQDLLIIPLCHGWLLQPAGGGVSLLAAILPAVEDIAGCVAVVGTLGEILALMLLINFLT